MLSNTVPQSPRKSNTPISQIGQVDHTTSGKKATSPKFDPNEPQEIVVENQINTVEKLGWIQVYDVVIFDTELSASAKLTLQAYYTYTNGRCTGDKDAWPSHKTLSKRLGISGMTLSRHKKELVKLGYIEIRERRSEGKTSLIILKDVRFINRLQNLASSIILKQPNLPPDNKNVVNPDNKNVASPNNKNVVLNNNDFEQELKEQQQAVVVETLNLSTKNTDTDEFEEKVRLLKELGLQLNKRTRHALQKTSIEVMEEYIIYAKLHPECPVTTFIGMMETNTKVAINKRKAKGEDKADKERARAQALQQQYNKTMGATV